MVRSRGVSRIYIQCRGRLLVYQVLAAKQHLALATAGTDRPIMPCGPTVFDVIAPHV